MSNSNGKSFIEALHIIASSSLGKLLIGAIIWTVTFAYAAGSLRNEVESLSRRLDSIEEKVDTIDYLVRRQANLPPKAYLPPQPHTTLQ